MTRPGYVGDMTFAKIASTTTAYGFPVIPLAPRTKDAFLKGWQSLATTDEKTIADWNTKNLHYNCGAVAKEDIGWILDVDNPIVFERIKQDTGHTLNEIDTLIVKSSGEKRHFYFKHDDCSRAMGNRDCDDADGKELFSVRAHNKYVVAAGSIHPDTGEPYETVREPLIGEIPVAPPWLTDWIMTQKQAQRNPAAAAANGALEVPHGSRDNWLFEQAKKLRDDGYSQDVVTTVLGHMNQNFCKPPMSDSVVQQKVQSAFTREPRVSQQSVEYVPTFCTADTIEPKLIRWLWRRRFAEKINLLVGNPDNGKGLVSIYVAARVTTGTPWFDGANSLPPSDVLIMAAEDDWDDIIVPRLAAAGADLRRVHKLNMTALVNGSKIEKELSLDRDRAVLDDYLQKHPEIRLVIIDPVSNYLGRTKMIDEQSVRDLLTPFKEMASRLHVAFICIMHLNKKIELDAIHRIGGAMAFVGIARLTWLCAPKPNEDGTDSDEMLMVKVKGNIVQRTLKGLSFKISVRPVVIEGEPTDTPYVEWKNEVSQSANELMSGQKRAAHRPNDLRQEAVIWLNQFLNGGAKPLDEVEYTGLKMHGFDSKLLQRARKDAGIVTFADGTKRKGRDGKMYACYSCRLPEESATETSGEGAVQQEIF